MKRLSLLLAVLFLVASVPAAATTTPGDSTYKRILLWQTEFGQNVRDTLHNYVGDWPMEASSALYDSFLGLFKNGGTDKNGVVYDAVAPLIDDRGYEWYPLTFEPVSSTFTSTDGNTIFSRSAVGNLIIDSYAKNYAQPPVASGAYYWAAFTRPKIGSYKLYLDVESFSGNVFFNVYNIKSENIKSGFFDSALSFSGDSLVRNSISCSYYKSDSSSDWISGSSKLRAYIVKVDGPSGVVFSGFGGGLTRGAGSGRKFDLISASKVSAGSGISRSDVLEQYAIFDEATKTVNIPQDDGTTVTKTAESWVYDYPTRTYTITTPTKETVKVVYAEDKVSVTDSSNTPKDYYYAEPEPLPTTTPSESTTTPGGGTTTAPDDSGGGGGIFGIFGWLKDLVNGIFGGIGDLFSTITAAFNSIASFGTGFANLIAHYFSYIPSEIAALIVLSFSALVLMRIFGR